MDRAGSRSASTWSAPSKMTAGEEMCTKRLTPAAVAPSSTDCVPSTLTASNSALGPQAAESAPAMDYGLHPVASIQHGGAPRSHRSTWERPGPAPHEASACALRRGPSCDPAGRRRGGGPAAWPPEPEKAGGTGEQNLHTGRSIPITYVSSCRSIRRPSFSATRRLAMLSGDVVLFWLAAVGMSRQRPAAEVVLSPWTGIWGP